MADITYSCTAMSYPMAVTPIDRAHNFATLRTSKNEVVVLSISSDGILSLIMTDSNGLTQKTDLNQKFGIPESREVYLLEAAQDADLTTYVVFVTKPKGNGKSTLCLVKPLKADDIAKWTDASSLASSLYAGPEVENKIKDVYLGDNDHEHRPVNPAHPYPFVAVSFTEGKSDTIDVARLIVTDTAWSFSHDLSLPAPADVVIKDMCHGRIEKLEGVFYLAARKSKPDNLEMGFLGLDLTREAPKQREIGIKAPPGAAQCVCFTNEGLSELLVGGDGLYYYSQSQLQEKEKEKRLFERLDLGDKQGGLFDGVQKLDLAVIGDHVSVWALNKENTIVYREMKWVEDASEGARILSSVGDTVPLMTAQKGGGRFATMKLESGEQALFSLSSANELRRLDQDPQSRVWNSRIVTTSSLDTYTDIDAHAIRVQCKDENGLPMKNTNLNVKTSANTSVVINGIRRELSQSNATPVTTDQNGVVTIIMDSNDLSAPILTVEGQPNDGQLKNKKREIDPLAKLSQAILDIKTGQDLKKIKLKNGEFLVDQHLSDAQLQASLEDLQQLATKAQSLKASSTITQPESHGAPVHARMPAQPQLHISRRNIIDDAHDAWDKFHHVGDQIGDGVRQAATKVAEAVQRGVNTALDAGKRFVQGAGDMCKVVVDWVGQAYHFVVDTAVKAGKAIAKVAEAIGAGVKKLIQFVGFLFEWDDILKTHNVFMNITNAGLLWGWQGLSTAQDYVHSQMETWKQTARNMSHLNKQLKSPMGERKAGKSAAEQGQNANSKEAGKMREGVDSPQANMGSYQVQHGGASLESATDPIGSGLDGTIKDLMERIGKLVGTFWDDLVAMFTDKDHSFNDLLGKLGADFAANLIDILEAMVDGMFKVIKSILQELAMVINLPIQIPVLSALYKKITKNELTILDGVCLLFAIPVTIIYKLVNNGKAPTSDMGQIADWATNPDKYNKLLREHAQKVKTTSTTKGRMAAVPPTIPLKATARENISHSTSRYSVDYDEPLTSSTPSTPPPRYQFHLEPSPDMLDLSAEFAKEAPPPYPMGSTDDTDDTEAVVVRQPLSKRGIGDAMVQPGLTLNQFKELVRPMIDWVSRIFPYAGPVVGWIGFTFFTIPGWFTSIIDYSTPFQRATNVVLHIFAFPYNLDDPAFNYKFANWTLGVIEVAFSWGPKRTEAVVSGLVALSQIVTIIPQWNAMEEAKGKKNPEAQNFDELVQIEQGTNIIAKLMSAATASSGGLKVRTSAIAIFMCNAGFVLSFVNAVRLGKDCPCPGIDYLRA